MTRTSLIVRLVIFGAALFPLFPVSCVAASIKEITVCGTSSKLNIDETNTTKEYQKFLGLWTGNWSSGRICSGLIVKKIESNGDAFIEYIYRPAKSSMTTSQSEIAHIEDGRSLTFNDKDGSRYTFILKPSSELAATFLSTAGTKLESTFHQASEHAEASATSSESKPRTEPKGPGVVLREFGLDGQFALDCNDHHTSRHGIVVTWTTIPDDYPTVRSAGGESHILAAKILSPARIEVLDDLPHGAGKAESTYEKSQGGYRLVNRIHLPDRKVMISNGFVVNGGFPLPIVYRCSHQQTTIANAPSQSGIQNGVASVRPAASDCFMGECFKEFIVSKTEKGAGIIEAKIRTETYFVAPANSAPAPPPIETIEVSCQSGNGYIQRPNAQPRKLREPEPDPPHATRAAKQLWEAVCGSQVEKPSAVNAAQVGVAPGTHVNLVGYCHASSKFDGYNTEFHIKVPSLSGFRSDSEIIAVLNEGMRRIIEHCKTDPNTIRDRHPDQLSRFLANIGIEDRDVVISAKKELGSSQWQITVNRVSETIQRQEQEAARQKVQREEFDRERARQQAAAASPPVPPPPPPTPTFDTTDPSASMLAKEVRGTLYVQFALRSDSRFCTYPRGFSPRPTFVFVGQGQRIGNIMINVIQDQVKNLREDQLLIKATNAILLSRKSSGLWGGGIEDCYQIDTSKCKECLRQSNDQFRMPFARFDLTSVDFVNEFQMSGQVGPTRGKSYHIHYNLVKLVPSSQPLGDLDKIFKSWQSTCIVSHNVVENEWKIEKCE